MISQLSIHVQIGRKTSVFVMLLLLLTFTNAIRFHQDTTSNPEYDKNEYLQQLKTIQAKFKEDITNIESKFVAINMKLNNTNISSSDKTILLQESLATERDSLYNIETYLKIPFALKSCQCINLTDASKKDISQQIKVVNQSVQQLEQSVDQDSNGQLYENPYCEKGNCAVISEVKSEIAKMNNYLQIMTDTITSKCCVVINYVYEDDLVDENKWVYGNITDSQYRLNAYQRAIQSNATRKICLSDEPYANYSTNQCFACEDPTPYFNLGTRSCFQSCQQVNVNFILNTTTHTCDYNQTCPHAMIFNMITLQCEKGTGTTSVCPKDKAFWNQQTFSCETCPADRPFFDQDQQNCRSCHSNQTWVPSLYLCSNSTQPQACSSGMVYNTVSKKCQRKAQTLNGNYSKCPPQRPNWSQKDFQCYECPVQKPFFNRKSEVCEACPTNTTWNYLDNECEQVSNCQKDEKFNTVTKKCEKNAVLCGVSYYYNVVSKKCQKTGATGNAGVCPPEAPFWNDKTMLCEQCKTATPYLNPSTGNCQGCPTDTTWSTIYQICQDNSESCEEDQTYNSTSKKCYKITCQSPTPIFNPTTNLCESCPRGTDFNKDTDSCEINQKLDKTNTSSCTKDTPYWNALRLRCQSCSNGQTYSSRSRRCINDVQKHNLLQNKEILVHNDAEKNGHTNHNRGLEWNQIEREIVQTEAFQTNE